MPGRARIAPATLTAVFAAAAARGQWHPTPAGLTALVGLDGYGWTVTLPPQQPGRRLARARIALRHGLGGVDRVDAKATAAETAAITARTRPAAPAYPSAPPTPPRPGGTPRDRHADLPADRHVPA